MQNAGENEKQDGENATPDQPQTDPNQVGLDQAGPEQAGPVAGGDRIAEILTRLATLELSLQQVRISVDTVAGGIGGVPSTLVTVLGSLNTLITNLMYLSNMASMESSAVNGLGASAAQIVNQCAMIYADTQMLRAGQAPACAQPSSFGGTNAAAFAEMSMQPGETGNI
jgi:hypothetical protein